MHDDCETMRYIQLRVSVVEKHCPNGFSYYEGRCFKQYHHPETWSAARQICASNNDNAWSKLLPHHRFDLASVRNKAENAFIRKTILGNDRTVASPHTQPWIGLYQDSSYSWLEPKWSDNCSVRYEKWAPSEPSDYQVCSDWPTDILYLYIYIYSRG